MNKLIEATSVVKHYDNGLVKALKGVSVSLDQSSITALTGPSGCGKSTLLNIIGTLDQQTSGTLSYQGKSLEEVGPLHSFRANFIGFVFQFHNLIPVLTLRENVEAALLNQANLSKREKKSRALAALDAMNLSHRADFYANKISGGERQRAAIARAMINNPKLLLADEPTGNVDSKTAELVLQRMRQFVESTGASLLIVTHDQAVASIADKQISMKDGRVLENPKLLPSATG